MTARSPIQQVLVIGSTGHVGAQIVAALADQGGHLPLEVGRCGFDSAEAAVSAVDTVASGQELDAIVIADLPDRAWRRRVLTTFDTDAWRAAADAPALSVLWCLQAIRRHVLPDRTRVVVVVPSVGIFGAAGYVAASAAGEAIRALVKSTARQWGPEGTALNMVAVAIEEGHGVTGTTLPALDVADVAAAVMLLCAPQARAVTGQTLMADGGAWMP
ncbi:MAG: SDR family oxidoreductase [Acidimicrobiia bacterium]